MKDGRVASTLLSMTMRSLGISGKEFRQLASRQTTRRRPVGHAVAKPLKLLYVQRAQTIILLPREEHGNFALLAPDNHRLALCRIQKGRETLLGIGSRNGKHTVYLSHNSHFRQPCRAAPG
jgi:hypothetical protein